MTYLRICDSDEAPEIKAKAIQRLARTLRGYAKATERWDVGGQNGINYFHGQCRVHCEYDTLYFRIDEIQLATYLACLTEYNGRFRRPELVRILAAA